MRHLRVGAGILGYVAIVMALYRVLPTWLVSDERYVNSIIIYIVISVLFLAIVYLKGVDSLEYFRRPRLGAASITAMVIAAVFVLPEFVGGQNEMKPWGYVIPGIILLLGIGISEEIFSRGLVFGMLRKYGERKAIVFSSVIFGLMHINVYVGDNWDLWTAYDHVVSAGCWGFLACSIMIATRSIWFVAVFHALVDWSIVFGVEDVATGGGGETAPVFTLWDNLVYPTVHLFVYIPAALLILRVNRGGWPRWIEKLALRFKLIVPDRAVG
jgi:membrane protease YdiL (CAAX protease family)